MVKLKQHLSHPMTIRYGFSCLCESMSAKRNLVPSCPMPPVVERIIGGPCSTFCILWLTFFWRTHVVCTLQLSLWNDSKEWGLFATLWQTSVKRLATKS